MLDWLDLELEQLIRNIVNHSHRIQYPWKLSRHAICDTPLRYRQAPRIPHLTMGYEVTISGLMVAELKCVSQRTPTVGRR
jgi:hypothetical protein